MYLSWCEHVPRWPISTTNNRKRSASPTFLWLLIIDAIYARSNVSIRPVDITTHSSLTLKFVAWCDQSHVPGCQQNTFSGGVLGPRTIFEDAKGILICYFSQQAQVHSSRVHRFYANTILVVISDWAARDLSSGDDGTLCRIRLDFSGSFVCLFFCSRFHF
jgi:hypothetical protein